MTDFCEVCGKVRTECNYGEFRPLTHNYYTSLLICDECARSMWNVCDGCGDYFDPEETKDPEHLMCSTCYQEQKEEEDG